MRDLLFGALAGDMADLTVLFLLMLPIFLIGVFIKWLYDKATT